MLATLLRALTAAERSVVTHVEAHRREAVGLFEAFHQRLAGQALLTFNSGVALGGTDVSLDSTGVRGAAFGKSNVVATRMTVTGGLRILSRGQMAGTDPMRAGAADVPFTSGIISMAIDGIGTAGRNDHTANETADLSVFPALIKRAAILLHRLGRSAEPSTDH